MTAGIAVPLPARSAEDGETQLAQAAPTSEQWGNERGGGPGHWMRDQDGPAMPAWHGMMHRMAMHRDPHERCTERLAWRAARRAYIEAKLNLTAEQRPL